MTIAVTGAGGILGRILVRELVRQGHEVRALVRSQPATAGLQGANIIEGDIRNRGDVLTAARSCEVIFHLASVVHAAGGEEPPPSVFSEVNVGGTENVIAAAQATGARVIFFSTINVYGHGFGVANEETICNPVGTYATTKLQAERVVQQYGSRGIILRLAAVFGSSMKGNYPRLVDAIRRHRFIRIGSGRARKTVVFETDVIRAAILVANSPAAAGAVYNVTDGALHTTDEIVDAIAAALHVTPPRLRIPAIAARLGGSAADVVRRSLGQPSHLRAAVEKYLEDVAVSADKIRRDLGFQASVDLATGWRAALTS